MSVVDPVLVSMLLREDIPLDEHPSSSIVGLPLIVAEALSIHKAMGATLPAVLVDCGDKGMFAPSQLDVALSRVTSLQNLQVRPWSLPLADLHM